MAQFYDAELSSIIALASVRLRTEMARVAPSLAEHAIRWMHYLSGTSQPEEYFKRPLAFPMLLLPWWLEKTIRGNPDSSFQLDVVYSTMNGYYFIRLIDNVMDNESTTEQTMLPILSFFHTELQRAYYRYFSYDHLFWDVFSTVAFTSAEAALKDATLDDIDRHQFVQTSARKVTGVRVPLAAVCYRYERLDVMDTWWRFVDALGCWHQMLNDLFDWGRDLQHDRGTYFLCEAARRKAAGESVLDWILREGLVWGLDLLEEWMAELRGMAGDLRCPDALAYLDRRRAALVEEREKIIGDLLALERLAVALHGTR